jgi:glycosyltransferase involved in cell wall biosynthesis
VLCSAFLTPNYPSRATVLICTGNPFTSGEQNLIDKLNLTNQVLLIDYATRSELQYLYQNVFALTYTSTYEGFGLPLLEAMSCGCPVIATNTSAMPEGVGDSGILLDQITEELSISHALNSLLDDTTRSNLIRKGFDRAKLFSWKNSISQHIEVYKSLVL